MKSIIKITSILFSVCFVFNIKAQQNPVMTHYTINPYLYNPSQVGEDGYLSVNAHYRKQWINMPDAPDTKLISVQGLVKNKFGIGGKIYYDQSHIVHDFGALFSYAYYVRAKKNPDKHYFSLGLSAGIKSQQLKFNEGVIKDDYDPKIFYNGASNTVFDAEAGFRYRVKGFHLAGFVSNLAPHSYSYRKNNIKELEFSPTYHIYGSVGYDIYMGSKKNFAVKPQALVRYIPDVPFQFDATLTLDWKNTVWLGGGYRYKNAGLWGLVGFRVHDMVSFTYSYEQSIDGFQAALGSTHEVTIGYRFKKKDKNKNLEKTLENNFKDLKSKMLAQKEQLLDSIREANEKIEELEGEINNSEKIITELKENTDTTIYKGNTVKYKAVGKVNYFLNSATIHDEQEAEAKPILEELLVAQESGKLIIIRIEGSASIEGSETYNLILSTKRNESMKDYLVRNGVDSELITLSSKGNTEPLMRDNAYEDKESAKPNPEDRYVKVYILYND